MDAYLISDLHLDESRPEIFDQLRHFLRTQAPRAQQLFILGDLFEYWVGDDCTTELARELACELARLGEAGCKVSFMAGNRDFLLGTAYAELSGMRILPDPFLTHLGGASVLLSHGDALCTDDVEYQAFRRQTHDPAWQQAFLAQSCEERHAFAARARAASAEHTGRASETIMDVNQDAVDAALDAAGVDFLIHGHTHRPAVHEWRSGAHSRTRMVLGDWFDQGSCIRIDGNQIELQTLPR